MNRKLQTSLKIIFGVVISLILIRFLSTFVDYDELTKNIRLADWRFLALTLLVMFVAHWFRGLRWAILLEDKGHSVSRKGLIAGTWFGYFVNILIPRGGEIARCTSVTYKYGLPVNQLIGSIIAERVLDLLLLIFVVILVPLLNLELFGSFFQERLVYVINLFVNNSVFLAVSIILFLASILLFLKIKDRFLLTQKINDFLRGILEGIKSIIQLKRKGLFILYTVGIWLMYILTSYLPFFAFPALSDLGFVNGMFVFVLGAIGMTIPAPGGIGSFHFVVMIGMTTVLGVSEEVSLAYAVTTHTLVTIFTLFVGGIYGLFLFKGKRENITKTS